MKTVKLLVLTLWTLTQVSCGGSGSDSTSQDDIDQINTGNVTDPQYAVGVARATDLTALPIDTYLNQWLSQSGGGQDLIELNLGAEAPEALGGANALALWAINIRYNGVESGINFDSDQGGRLTADEMEVRIFSNYTNHCCLNQADPFGNDETADLFLLAVDGYIDFTSFGSARFSLDFQHVSDLRGYDVYGDVVTVEGCWVIPVREVGPRGCELE